MIIIIIYQSSFIKLVLTVQFCVFCLGMLRDNRSTNHQQSRNQQSNLLHEDRCFTRVDQACLNWECSRVYHLDWWVTSSQKVRISVRKIRRVCTADRIRYEECEVKINLRSIFVCRRVKYVSLIPSAMSPPLKQKNVDVSVTLWNWKLAIFFYSEVLLAV